MTLQMITTAGIDVWPSTTYPSVFDPNGWISPQIPTFEPVLQPPTIQWNTQSIMDIIEGLRLTAPLIPTKEDPTDWSVLPEDLE